MHEILIDRDEYVNVSSGSAKDLAILASSPSGFRDCHYFEGNKVSLKTTGQAFVKQNAHTVSPPHRLRLARLRPVRVGQLENH
jgi:hypothetical protein